MSWRERVPGTPENLAMLARQREAAAQTIITPITDLDADRGRRYSLAALRSECEIVAQLPEGQRNHGLNIAWFRMARHIGSGGLHQGEARDALTQAARAAGLPDAEIATVLRDGPTSGLAAGMQIGAIVASSPQASDRRANGIQ